MENKKLIAYGISKILQMYLEKKELVEPNFEYVVDNFTTNSEVNNLSIKKDADLRKENFDGVLVVVFAVANTSIQKIESRLISFGLEKGKNFIFYSDFLLDSFNKKLDKHNFGTLSKNNYLFALEMNRNLNIPVHTTILGNALLLHLIAKTTKILKSPIAEIGAYRGGASKMNMFKLMSLNDERKYFVFDSFEGFSDISKNDPNQYKKGDYSIDTTYGHIESDFASNNNFKLIKGFVPDTFSQIEQENKFSIVFYDADLYQPALDTFAFFENKIEKGGFLVIHDYEAEKGGFEGVKQAVTEYFKDKTIEVLPFYETTMAVIRF
jgi:hypothetical protein